MDPTSFYTLILLAFCLVGLSWFAGSEAPYVPTTSPDLKKALQAAGVKRGKTFWELGSGDGRVALAAAKMGALSFGIEQSWIRVLYSRWQAKKLKLTNAIFYHGNALKFKYSDADIIYIYLLTKGVNKLEPKLKQELKKGAVIITQTYHLQNLKPNKQVNNFQIYKV